MWRSVGCVAVASMLTLAVGCSGAPPENAPDRSSFSGPANATVAPEAPVPKAPVQDSTYKPDIITTGTVRMTVANPKEAADKFVAATTAAGGHVDSRSEQSGSGSPTVELTLRIPSDKVDGVLANIDELGVVDSMQIGYDDVTAQRADLDARMKALQTSVNRLLELMNKGATTSDVLEAERSLTERQANLDSITAQRAALGDQIKYATITVSLGTQPEAIAPGGFFGAVKQGWQSLLNFGGSLAAMIGFLLPWLPVLAVFGGAVWLLGRRWRRTHPKVSHARPVLPPPPYPPVDPPVDPPVEVPVSG